MTNPTTKITAVLGSALLLFAAGYRLFGRSDNALSALWSLPAFHWVFIAFLSVGLSRYKSNSCAAILMAFGVMILGDTMLLASKFSLSPSTYALGAAGALLLVSGLKLRKQMRAG